MWLFSDFIQYDSFYICGDIHGEFRTLVYEIKRRQITNSVVLVAGDCGIGFEKPQYYEQLYRKISKALQKSNCLLLLMRGNHDDPIYFRERLIDFPYMKTLPDYSVVRIKNRNILCVGGGISADRVDRINAMWLAGLKRKKLNYYWEEESPVFEPDSLSGLKENKIWIDTVVTHTAPSFCMPATKKDIHYWYLKDQNLENDIFQEREVMNQICNFLLKDKHPLSNWFYGHFHDSYHEDISGIRFRLLNILELCELR